MENIDLKIFDTQKWYNAYSSELWEEILDVVVGEFRWKAADKYFTVSSFRLLGVNFFVIDDMISSSHNLKDKRFFKIIILIKYDLLKIFFIKIIQKKNYRHIHSVAELTKSLIIS